MSPGPYNKYTIKCSSLDFFILCAFITPWLIDNNMINSSNILYVRHWSALNKQSWMAIICSQQLSRRTFTGSQRKWKNLSCFQRHSSSACAGSKELINSKFNWTCLSLWILHNVAFAEYQWGHWMNAFYNLIGWFIIANFQNKVVMTFIICQTFIIWTNNGCNL